MSGDPQLLDGGPSGPLPAPLTAEELGQMFKFEMKARAKGVRREDGLTSAQIEANLKDQHGTE